MKLFKKNENKKTTKLPMTGKVKKSFRYYCMAVMAMRLYPEFCVNSALDVKRSKIFTRRHCNSRPPL